MPANLKRYDQVKIYISYSHSPRDRVLVFALADYLEKRLSKVIGRVVTEDDPLFKGEIDGAFYRENLVVGQIYGSGGMAVAITCDRKVVTEADTWWHEFDKGSIKRANFILLMISPDYLASDHCRSLMDVGWLREKEGLATVVPVILRSVGTPAPNSWTYLPRNGLAVTDWPDLDSAFKDIAEGIIEAIPLEVRQDWINKGGLRFTVEASPRVTDDNRVHLGLTVPPSVAPASEFVVRFAAYTPPFREWVSKNLTLEGPTAKQMLDLQRCQWRPGTAVSVMLHSKKCRVTEPQKTFLWNGEWEILRFDVEVLPDVEEGTAILKFDVYIEGFVVASLRPEITIAAKAASEQSREFEIKVPRSAFASYSSQDREQVMGRIRSLQIVADIDVFVDCLSIRPGEEWKNALHKEISNREMFWLFWSREAMASKFVEWEWHTAYSVKGKSLIQPHPLEPTSLAPPPKELEDLQFGDAFEAYLYSLRSRQT